VAKGDETKLEKKLIPVIDSYKKIYDLLIESKIKIFTDVTCLPVKGKGNFKLSFAFSQVDLAIYKELNFNSLKEITKDIKFFGYPKQSKNTFNIPLICFELKSGNITSDAIRARNHIANQIKNIYPFAYYVFLAENTRKKDTTVYRQGKHFTHFYISTQKFEDNDYNNIKDNIVTPLLNNLYSNELINKIEKI